MLTTPAAEHAKSHLLTILPKGGRVWKVFHRMNAAGDRRWWTFLTVHNFEIVDITLDIARIHGLSRDDHNGSIKCADAELVIYNVSKWVYGDGKALEVVQY